MEKKLFFKLRFIEFFLFLINPLSEAPLNHNRAKQTGLRFMRGGVNNVRVQSRTCLLLEKSARALQRLHSCHGKFRERDGANMHQYPNPYYSSGPNLQEEENEVIRGVMLSMSAFLACHQCYCAGSSLAWGLNLWALVCGIF